MSMGDRLTPVAALGASFTGRNALGEALLARGVFQAEHLRAGRVIWSERFPNTVATVGKNLMLNTLLAGSSYSVTGPYMGLIGATPTTAAGDTMGTHAGWTEVGGTNAPAYSGSRPTCAWSSASGGSIGLSAALSFTFTASGTVGGAFIVLGTGAVATKDNTSGTLLSAGAFSTGNRDVLEDDQLNISYSLSV